MRKRKGGGGAWRIFCLPPYEGRNMSTNTTERRFPVLAMVLLGAAFALAAVVLASFAGGTAQAQVGTEHLAADLRITKAVKPNSVPVGQRQTFVIKVTNERGDTARSVVVTDSLPNVVNFVRASKAGRYRNRAYVEHRTAELQSVDNIDGARARTS